MPRAAAAKNDDTPDQASPGDPELAEAEAPEPEPDPSVWIFTYREALTYPEAKDAAGRPIGHVAPGDAVVFRIPPQDGRWTLADKKQLGQFVENSTDIVALAQLGIAREPEPEDPPADNGPKTATGQPAPPQPKNAE